MLYGVTAVMFGLLGAVEVVTAPSAVRTALRCVIVLGGFAAMAGWGGFNRVPLGQRGLGTCAPTTITGRGIQSRRPAPHTPGAAPTPAGVAAPRGAPAHRRPVDAH